MHLLWIGLGGAAGSLARYALSIWLAGRAGTSFPWGTWAVNLTGSFALGAFLAWSQGSVTLPGLRLAVATGFLGAYTTFSTMQWEAFALLRAHQWRDAAAYLVGSVVLGLLLLAAGYASSQALLARGAWRGEQP